MSRDEQRVNGDELKPLAHRATRHRLNPVVELSRCAAGGKKCSVHGFDRLAGKLPSPESILPAMHITNYPSITQFQQHVELKDFREPTKKEYVRYVRKLAEHFQCDPATLTEDHLRQYFLFLRQHKHYKAATMKGAKYSLLCFYVEHLKQKQWSVFRELRIVKPQVLPIVLSRSEVQTVLAAVREPRFRTCLILMYHCGLRVGEAVRIEVKDVHGRENPPRLYIKNGKGGKDRYVPLAPGMVQQLRQWWRTHQNPRFLRGRADLTSKV